MSPITKLIFLITVNFISISIIFCNSTMAQVDPSSVLLLKKGATKEDYSSSRYTVKPRDSKDASKVVAEPISSQSTQPGSGQPVTGQPIAERRPQVHSLPTHPIATTSESITPGEYKSNEANGYEATANDASYKVLDPDVFMGIEDVEALKKHFHPQDRRKNIIEFSLGINYFYQNSSSPYWHRNYSSQGPGIDTSLNLWMTPFLGVHAEYSTSLNSDIRGSLSGLEYLDADHSWFSSGLRFRKFFGLSRKAKSLNFGLDYYEYQLQLPTSASERMGLLSKGVRLSLEIDVPQTVSTSWQVGFELQPDLSHNELIGDQNIKSGISNNSSSVGLWYGKRLWLNRKNQFYWKLSHKAETNKYSGSSWAEDPKLGEFVKGVRVNNSTSFFQMGFTWGR